MKRFVARFSALLGVIVAGTIAIAQAQRMVEPRSVAVDRTDANSATAADAASPEGPDHSETTASEAATPGPSKRVERASARAPQGGDRLFANEAKVADSPVPQSNDLVDGGPSEPAIRGQGGIDPFQTPRQPTGGKSAVGTGGRGRPDGRRSATNSGAAPSPLPLDPEARPLTASRHGGRSADGRGAGADDFPRADEVMGTVAADAPAAGAVPSISQSMPRDVVQAQQPRQPFARTATPAMQTRYAADEVASDVATESADRPGSVDSPNAWPAPSGATGDRYGQHEGIAAPGRRGAEQPGSADVFADDRPPAADRPLPPAALPSNADPNAPTDGGRYGDLPRYSDQPVRSGDANDAFARPPVSQGESRVAAAVSRMQPAPEVPGGGPASSTGITGTGRPGPQGLEGTQVPTLSIEKVAPAELQVGQAATITLKIRNAGSVPAHDVVVRDEVPEGARLLNTTPRAETDGDGRLKWSLGTLSVGATAEIEMELIPTAEGEIGSVASVSFRSEASVRVRVTQPVLALEVSAPRQVMIGGDVRLSIRVSNTGTGEAHEVVLIEQLPDQLEHPAGRELEYDIGTLAPGESRDIELTLTAAAAGRVQNVLVAKGAGELLVEEPYTLEVLAPALAVSIDGPARRYLERKATYRLSVTNPGTASARDVRLTARLPEGMKFVEADNLGQYDAATRTVEWLLEELPAGQSGDVALTMLPVSAGEQKIAVEATAQPQLQAEDETTVQVDGVVAIFFEVADVEDPIEVDGQTTYEIRIVNQGTKTATNLEVVALLPEELTPLDADAPVRHIIDGQRVLFDPMPKLAPKADTTYRVKVQAQRPGDLRFRVQIRTSELRTPVTKEESTRVYSDQ